MPKASAPASFDERKDRLEKKVRELQTLGRRLEKDVHELQTQSGKPTKDSPGGAPSKPHESPQPATSEPPAPTTGGAAVRELFQRRCVKCHGADGTGKPARDRLPEIPDFTKRSWQARRSDAQLVATILDGKDEMPSWRGKISQEQARSLVAYVRAFTPATEKSGEGQQDRSASTEPAEAEPPKTFAGKLIGWLGGFHPPSVHFPIALLTVAAVAELLLMVTGKSKRDLNAVSRYCVGFGALTAVVAGVLGWFLGGFQVTDASWVKTTHRWLGTSTVALAGLALVLSELCRHPNRHRTRISFRVALFIVAALVSVTGFFGGALVFGFKHYSWPR